MGKGAAYDLYLARELEHAELERVATSAEALPYFLEHRLKAVANVRQLTTATSRPGVRVIEKPFVQIRQAMALPAAKSDAQAG
jgi:polar amino acid transport system substrate-binding protein